MSYRLHPVDTGTGAPLDPGFLAISPTHRIPALIDPDGPDGEPISLFDSGAILLYLASKTGRFLPADTRGRYEALQWLMFQAGDVGPILGQVHHFRHYAPQKIPYAVERFSHEARRLYAVMERRLNQSGYLGGSSYSIADMAVFPWLRSWKSQGVVWSHYPRLRAWYDELSARPAVQRGCLVLAEQDRRQPPEPTRPREAAPQPPELRAVARP